MVLIVTVVTGIGWPISSAAARDEATAEVALTAITPVAPSANGSVRARGTVTNVGEVDLHEVQASFWVDSTPMTAREDVAAAAREVPGERLATRITEPYDLIDQVADVIEPGETARFELAIPVEYLNLAGPGTYMVGADVRATIPPIGNRETVGRVRTLLPLVSDDATKTPVELTLLVPLTADPAYLDGSTVLDRAAAQAFAPEGRLRRLLDLGAAYDVTWLVDPAVLELAEVVASGYRFADGTEPTDDTAARNAREWLTLAEEVLTEDNTLWLPYADPDLTAVLRRGLRDYFDLAVAGAQLSATNHGQSGLLPAPPATGAEPGTDSDAGGPDADPDGGPDSDGETETGTESPEQPAGDDNQGLAPTDDTDGSGRPPTDQPSDEPTDDPTDDAPEEPSEDQPSAVFALPGNGFADPNTLSTMVAAGVGGAVLSGAGLPELPNDGTTPVVSIATPSGPLTALVADPNLTAAGPPGKQRAILLRQRLLAETALVATAGGESTPRRLVALLPRDWEPNRAAESLLRTVNTTSWINLVPASVPLAEPPRAYAGPVRYPDRAERAELPDTTLAALQSYSVDATDYLSMLAEPEAEQLRVAREFLRGASTSWRDNGGRAVALLRSVRMRFAAAKNNVEMLSPRFVTLSSSSGSFPVTIANENDFPVRVTVRVTSQSADRINVAPLEPITIPPNRRETARPLVEVLRGGVVQVEVGLTTPAGTPFGERRGFAVRASDYGLVGWGVLGVGAGLLGLALILRIVRRKPRPTTTHPTDEPSDDSATVQT